MNIKIEFLDKAIGSIRIVAKEVDSYFKICYEGNYDEDHLVERGINSMKIKSSSEVWDFLTKYSLSDPLIKSNRRRIKIFHTNVMKALSTFVEENREVFAESKI